MTELFYSGSNVPEYGSASGQDSSDQVAVILGIETSAYRDVTRLVPGCTDTLLAALGGATARYSSAP